MGECYDGKIGATLGYLEEGECQGVMQDKTARQCQSLTIAHGTKKFQVSKTYDEVKQSDATGFSHTKGI